MVKVKKLILDILKPHQPNALDFSQVIAATGDDYRVHVTVLEVDERTESLQLVIEGNNIDFDALHQAVNDLGGSLHSIDEVEVASEPDSVEK
jgi:uncharacterized protein